MVLKFLWAAEWRQVDCPPGDLLPNGRAGIPALFRTRRECMEWIQKEYGYIAFRTDLRNAPHYWRVPRPVKVTMRIET